MIKSLIFIVLLALTACGGGGGGGDPTPARNTGGWAYEHSLGLPAGPVEEVGGYVIHMPSQSAEPHYVTKASGPLAGKSKITMTYKVEGGPIVPVTAPTSPSILTLYFQRAGDNWTAEREAYRWYAKFANHLPITEGDHTIEAPLDGEWTAAVSSSRSSNPQAFAAALQETARVGFVLGGGTGLGHGVYAVNPAKITIQSFRVE